MKVISSYCLFRFKMILAILLLYPFSFIQAATFNVANLTDLQSSLNNASANGESDTINIATNNYLVGTTLTYSSSENFSLLIRGAIGTVFNGNNTTQVFNLVTTANNANITVEELIIENGIADYGGGIFIQTGAANMIVTNATFNNNTANNVGGGLNMFSNTGNTTITNCNFNGNDSPNITGYPLGTAGGLFIQTDGANTQITVSGCSFSQNTAERDGAGAMLYPLGSTSTVIAQNNTFDNNTAKEFGGGCWIRCPNINATITYNNNILTNNSSSMAGSGGGTYIQMSTGIANIIQNSHIGNVAIWYGGGLWLEHGGGTLNVDDNIFSNNNGSQGGGGLSVYLESGTSTVHHNIFNGNQTASSGGGINFSTNTGNSVIYNNTFYGNTASDGGDVYQYFDNGAASADFYNNILYGSSAPALNFSGAATVSAEYSLISGGTSETWFGPGCIDIDPLFVDSGNDNFNLSWSNFPINDATKSPCIDSGDPGSVMDVDGTTSDMGALFFNQSTVSIEEQNINPVEFFQNSPNPFNASTLISYILIKPCYVTIKIYSINGKKIITLLDGESVAGEYQIVWDATGVKSGIYLCEIVTNEYRITKRMILTR